ncbi:MAG TPA: hypothetical protein VI893_10405 [Thermoplasmata archaeon]|nr:hypothetical protein [Thermoplasmata archaeon]
MDKMEPGPERAPLTTVNGWLLPVISPYRYPPEALRLARETPPPSVKNVVSGQ